MTTWKNPKPEKKVVSIDYIGRKSETPAVPFCGAMTVEGELAGVVDGVERWLPAVYARETKWNSIETRVAIMDQRALFRLAHAAVS